MPETVLILSKNSFHNVPATTAAARNSLRDLARLYLATEVAGQSQATRDAKRRDLNCSLAF